MKVSPTPGPNTITFNTTDNKKPSKSAFKWWKAPSKAEKCDQLLCTAAYLKESQNYRYKQAAVYARLYGNQSLFSFMGANMSKMDQMQGLPMDRPTFNLVQSATDTLVSRISQNRPSPVFLTDAGDYKQRKLAKQLNNFVQGEFHATNAYAKATMQLRDALVEGTGILKVYATEDNKVGIDRVLLTELLVDPNECIYGEPRQIYQIKLVDRMVLAEMCPTYKGIVDNAERAYVDNSSNANQSVSDLVMVVEGWHLKSGKNAKDGRHTIACSAGILVDEEWTKDRFPFIFLHYAPRLLGFWAQGLTEQLMGTQLEINSLLYTISRAIKLVGVPRVFVEDGSKVVKAHLNNDIGTIVTYQGTKPEYTVAPCVPEELYAQLQRLINYGYQQCGVSALDASSEKPAGLNSGEAIRTYDDISTDRFAALARRYDDLFIDLAYLVVDVARDIAEDTGEYKTVYPAKNGTQEVDLPLADILKENPFIIKCFNMSSLPRDPAGRMQKVTEMITSGMITIKEGRRLLDYPDLDQMERLANASEERIFQILDNIVEEGKYQSPDPFMDLDLASELVVQYYNLYASAKLEEDRQEMLRDFYTQIGDVKAEAIQAIQMQAQATGAPSPQPGAPQPGGQSQVPSPGVTPPPAQSGVESQAGAA